MANIQAYFDKDNKNKGKDTKWTKYTYAQYANGFVEEYWTK